jgi:hypothetical protein
MSRACADRLHGFVETVRGNPQALVADYDQYGIGELQNFIKTCGLG